jgi:hypothetical protein
MEVLIEDEGMNGMLLSCRATRNALSRDLVRRFLSACFREAERIRRILRHDRFGLSGPGSCPAGQPTLCPFSRNPADQARPNFPHGS